MSKKLNLFDGLYFDTNSSNSQVPTGDGALKHFMEIRLSQIWNNIMIDDIDQKLLFNRLFQYILTRNKDQSFDVHDQIEELSEQEQDAIWKSIDDLKMVFNKYCEYKKSYSYEEWKEDTKKIQENIKIFFKEHEVWINKIEDKNLKLLERKFNAALNLETDNLFYSCRKMILDNSFVSKEVVKKLLLKKRSIEYKVPLQSINNLIFSKRNVFEAIAFLAKSKVFDNDCFLKNTFKEYLIETSCLNFNFNKEDEVNSVYSHKFIVLKTNDYLIEDLGKIRKEIEFLQENEKEQFFFQDLYFDNNMLGDIQQTFEQIKKGNIDLLESAVRTIRFLELNSQIKNENEEIKNKKNKI